VRPRPLDINEDIDLQYQSVLLNDMPHATPPPDAVRWKCCVCHRSDNREEICIGVSGDQHWEHKRSDCEKCKRFPARTKSMGERLLENVPMTMGTEECERSVGTVFQLPNPDAIYSRDEEKERKVGRHLMFVFAHGPRAAEAR
jgi:hypothetical protein